MVFRWLDSSPFREQYARARDLVINAIAQLALDEACKPRPPEEAQNARLAYDARRWYVSKLAPHRYGDKLELDARMISADLTPPPSDRERVRAFAGLLARAKFTPPSNDDSGS